MAFLPFLRSRQLHIFLSICIFAWIGFKLYVCANAIGTAHLDFAVFWEAARIWLQDGSLYPPLTISEHPPLLWLYPATAMYSVFWAAYFSLSNATAIWLGLKTFVIVLATTSCLRRFRTTLPTFVVLAVVFLSWGRPVLLDFWNGNFVTLEWSLLLAGTMLWSRERLAPALAAIGYGASFKMLPLGYAFAWFVAEKNLTRRMVGMYAGFFAVSLAILYFSFQGESHAYLALFRQIPQMDVMAWKNQDFSHQSFPYFFFRLTHDFLGLKTEVWQPLGWLSSLGIGALLLYYRKTLQTLSREWQASVLWVAFSLALPRNKDYNLIALIWPSLLWLEYSVREIQKRSHYRREAWFGIALIVLSGLGGQNRDTQTVASFLFSQKRFLIELGFAFILFRAALRQSTAQPSTAHIVAV